jgi:hypothetical protein
MFAILSMTISGKLEVINSENGEIATLFLIYALE